MSASMDSLISNVSNAAVSTSAIIPFENWGRMFRENLVGNDTQLRIEANAVLYRRLIEGGGTPTFQQSAMGEVTHVYSSYAASMSISGGPTGEMKQTRTMNKKLKGPYSKLDNVDANERPVFRHHVGLTWIDFKRNQDEARLCRAVSLNDTERVRCLLAQGISPNCYDSHCRAPLHLAVSRGLKDMVQLLLDNGANPNVLDGLENTPLHLAACTNHVEIVTLLLDRGTDVALIDLRGRSPLQLAQSKLKILQNSKDGVSKSKVVQIVDMLMQFLTKKKRSNLQCQLDAETELLAGFQTRLKITDDREQVNREIDGLSKLLDKLSTSSSSR